MSQGLGIVMIKPLQRVQLVGLAMALALVSCTPEPTPAPEPTATSDASQQASPGSPGNGEESTPQAPWVQDRVRALEGLYPFAPAGKEWLESYDLRQMVGQPGWFGSYGHDAWAGVGQAIPVKVLHELSHSYYGAFPVTGWPDLSWHLSSSNEPSPALRQYHEDLKAFMAQPPDRYEPLRDRFRNLPGLSRSENPDLFHFGEAELVYMVGGNLDLVPPILRRYFDQLLQPGEFQTWEEAIGWYLGLSQDDARLAGDYFGLVHFPLAGYQGLRSRGRTQVASEIRSILEEEEQQRLKDFAHQYETIKEKEFGSLDEAAFEGSFNFWRGLLGEMLGLHRKHPQTLAGEAAPLGAQIAAAFDTFLEAERLSQEEEVQLFQEALQNPLIRDFTVLLKSRVLVDVIVQTPASTTDRPVETVIRKFAEKLRGYFAEVEGIVAIGRKDPSKGALALEGFLADLSDEEQKSSLGTVLGMIREADASTARDLLNRADDATLLRMVGNNPGVAKNGNVQPERLLAALHIEPDAPRSDIVEGLLWLLENSAGNFQIDAPFTRLAHQVIADVAARNPTEALAILQETHLPLMAQPFAPFLTDQPDAASRALSSDIAMATALIAAREGYAETPHGVIHALMFHDPVLAGRLVVALGVAGRDDIVTDSLIVFAYDARRLAASPGARLSLENDKRFLEHLIEVNGQRWVQESMAQAVHRYDAMLRQQHIDEEFLHAYAETLRQVLALEEDSEKRQTLRGIFEGAFQGSASSAWQKSNRSPTSVALSSVWVKKGPQGPPAMLPSR